MSTRLLFIFRHAPYGTSLAREGLDALLAAAVYEQEIAVLFLNDGVFQLLKQQDTGTGQTKNHGRMLTALPVYGVDRIYVHQDSLKSRGLTVNDLLLDPAQVSNIETRELMNSFNQILSF